MAIWTNCVELGTIRFMKKILVIHGPNLNMLGVRETLHYGEVTLAQINQRLEIKARELEISLDSFQSNHEGDIIDRVHDAAANDDGLIMNPGGYTHTSIAIRDAVLASGLPMIEVHLTNIYKREPFRHHSYFSDIAAGTITGLGSYGYELALEGISDYLVTQKRTSEAT